MDGLGACRKVREAACRGSLAPPHYGAVTRRQQGEETSVECLPVTTAATRGIGGANRRTFTRQVGAGVFQSIVTPSVASLCSCSHRRANGHHGTIVKSSARALATEALTSWPPIPRPPSSLGTSVWSRNSRGG